MNVSPQTLHGHIMKLIVQKKIDQVELDENVDQIGHLHQIVLDSPVIMLTSSLSVILNQCLQLASLIAFLEIFLGLEALDHGLFV